MSIRVSLIRRCQDDIMLNRNYIEKGGLVKESRGCARLVRLADYSFLISLHTFCIKAESMSPAA